MTRPAPDLYVLRIVARPHLAAAVADHLFEHGLRGLEEQTAGDDTILLTYGESRTDIERYADRARAFFAPLTAADPDAGAATVSVDTRPNDDWATSWMKYFRQTRLTPGLVVQPSWDDTPAPAGTRRVIIEPNMAFGFGTHATTQLAARRVEWFFRQHAGGELFDVGTGTGLLALVALLHGATRAVGIDIDPVAVDAARQNATLNNLADRAAFSTDPASAVPGRFAMVVANITAPAILELADDLVARLAPGGRLAVTGVLSAYRAEVLLAMDERGLHHTFIDHQDEWCLLEWTNDEAATT